MVTQAYPTTEEARQEAEKLLYYLLAQGYSITSLHQYTNEDGHPLFWRVRLDHPEKEKEISELLVEKLKGVFIHVGSLRKNMALISKADLMIDNCSAPSHISSALKIKTLVLMGADYKNIYRNEEIYKKNSFLFYKNVHCRDSFWSRCLPPDPCKNKVCLDHSIEDVLKKSLELLYK